MRKKLHVGVVYNEPVTESSSDRKYISETGILHEGRKNLSANATVLTDLSEVGVLEERENIVQALQAVGYRCSMFNVDRDITRLLNYIKNEKPDVIFNLCESVGNEAIHEMHIAGLFELFEIPYTGSDPLTLGIALNKVKVKELLLYHQLLTPQFQIIRSPVRITLDESLNFPLIVKPSREDASLGISTESVVNNFNDLKKRVRYIIEQFDQPALAEEYIDGRELNVAIIGNRKPIVLPISEIDMSTMPKQYHRIITYNAKWMKETDEYIHTKGVCPAILPTEIEATIKSMALKAYRSIGCRDYARVDFRLSKENRPYLLEINPNPDISDDAGFARSARTYGFTFEELINKIVEFALERTT